MLNTSGLCRENVTSHGTFDRTVATVAPRPTRTNTAGKAQQMRVPKDVSSETAPSTRLR